MTSVSHLVSQKYRDYKKALTVNAVDLTDDAKPYFDTSLATRVGLNSEVKEMKFKVEKMELCAESSAESSPPPEESFAPSQPPRSPLALPAPNAGPTGRAVGKGLIVFSKSDNAAPATVAAGETGDASSKSAVGTGDASSTSAAGTGGAPKPKVHCLSFAPRTHPRPTRCPLAFRPTSPQPMMSVCMPVRAYAPPLPEPRWGGRNPYAFLHRDRAG